MLPFEQLTVAGRARRLRRLALSVLDRQYELSSVRLRLVSTHSFNTVFRVDATQGRFALRLGDACRIHPIGVEDVEAAWLDALDGAGFEVPRNVPAIDGKRWVSSTESGIPGQRVCTVFSWVDGHEMRNKLSPDHVEASGRLLGQLHRHAASASLPVPDALDARSAIYLGNVDLVAGYSAGHGSLFREATHRVQEYIDELWSGNVSGPHLLHGDFGPHNVLVSRSKLTVIDFQDLRRGMPVQDLGITLADLDRQNPLLTSRFIAGYEAANGSVDLSPEESELLAAGRNLNIMNLALTAPNSGIGEVLQPFAERVVAWMTQTAK